MFCTHKASGSLLAIRQWCFCLCEQVMKETLTAAQRDKQTLFSRQCENGPGSSWVLVSIKCCCFIFQTWSSDFLSWSLDCTEPFNIEMQGFGKIFISDYTSSCRLENPHCLFLQNWYFLHSFMYFSLFFLCFGTITFVLVRKVGFWDQAYFVKNLPRWNTM